MGSGSVKRILGIMAGIVIAYFVAVAVSDAVLIVFHLSGPVAMVVNMVLFAGAFFAALSLIQRFTGTTFFGGWEE